MGNIVEYILQLQSNQFESGIASATNNTNALNAAVDGIGSTIRNAFGVAALTMFAQGVIAAGTAVEDAQVGLTTLLKSSEQAQAVIQQTMKDATTTPFSFESLLASNKALISTGEEASKAREDVLNLANAIAATGGGDNELQRMVINMQQIRNTGEATALDVKQFAFAGINLYAALENAGIKYAKGTSLSYEQVSAALRKAHEEGGIYFNGLENMAGNTSVQISNLGDAMFQLKNKMFNDLKPTIDETVSTLKDAIKWLDENSNGLLLVGKTLVQVGALFAGFRLAAMGATAALALARPAMLAFTYAIASGTTVLEGAAVGMTAFGTAVNVALGPVGWLALAVTGIVTSMNLLISAQERWNTLNKESTKNDNDAIESGLALKMASVQAKSGLSKDKWVEQSEQKLNAALAKNSQELNEALASGKDTKELTKRNATLLAEKNALTKFNTNALTTASKAPLTNAKGNQSATKTHATGSKSVTINVHINDLVKQFTVYANGINDTSKKIGAKITDTLISSINDFQRIVPE
jgi:hypothetical protein